VLIQVRLDCGLPDSEVFEAADLSELLHQNAAAGETPPATGYEQLPFLWLETYLIAVSLGIVMFL
jgi:hypothetical protein